MMEAVASAAETPLEVSVILPCLNEADTLEVCVTKAVATLRALGLRGEVVRTTRPDQRVDQIGRGYRMRVTPEDEPPPALPKSNDFR